MVSVPFKQLTIINCLTNYLKKELTGLPEKVQKVKHYVIITPQEVQE
jgi:hypothetical protein